jgi:hypothetical protein
MSIEFRGTVSERAPPPWTNLVDKFFGTELRDKQIRHKQIRDKQIRDKDPGQTGRRRTIRWRYTGKVGS